ncbi:MAG TPA: hypothetical protein VKY37_09800 [Brumimicrobium sp.]|nr:hypothetical protein [Brumimicrobium sp.]
MKLFIVFFLLALTPVAFSQNEWWKSESESKMQEKKKEREEVKATSSDDTVVNNITETKEIQPGKINVVKSSSIDKIIKFKSAKISPNTGPVMDGYRIQLFFDQSRSAVDKARSTALQIDSDTPTYIEYKAPNYLLLLGDYRSQLEAEKARASLIYEFPEAIVIEDKIYLPIIKDEEVEEKE